MITVPQATYVLMGNAYTKFGGVERTIGANVMQSPQAPPQLPSSIPHMTGRLPNVGGGLVLQRNAYSA